jgi:cbb3-type cytochrome oxidase subunit 3
VRSPTRAVIYSWFLINFKLCLVSVLHRALRRPTIQFNFRIV